MTAVKVSAALTAVLRAGAGSLGERVDRALALLLDQLGMQLAEVSEFRDGELTVTYSRAATDPPAAEPLTVGVGAPLTAHGRIIGAVCVSATAPTVLGARDEVVLHTVAAHLGALLTERPEPVGARPVDATDVETVTRPLLRLLRQVIGLDGVYLNLYDRTSDELVVTYAEDSRGLGVAEGTIVAWDGSLCRRAHRDGGFYQGALAASAGIATWLSVPVLDHEGRMIGTLCGGSRAGVPAGEHTLAVARSVAGLIADQLARDAAHCRRLDVLRDSAERDALTGLANRSGVHRWLGAALPRLAAGDRVLMLAFLDLDGFKKINDTYGHGMGDEILCGFGERLSSLGRGDDLSGRLGGDEFVVAALLPAASDRQAWCDRVRAAAEVRVSEVHAAASVGVAAVTHPPASVEDLLACADLAMYRDKQHRRSRLPGRFPAARAGADVVGG